MMRPRSFVLCIAFLLVATSTSCATPSATSSLIPGFLIGTWRTDTESHRDAFLRLTATTIAFGTVEGTVERHVVYSVTRTEDSFGPLYTIEYRDLQGQRDHLQLYFDDRIVRLRNQRQMEWRWSRF